MTPKERAILAYHQQRRERSQLASEADLERFDREYEASLEAIRREMAPIKACINIKRKS